MSDSNQLSDDRYIVGSTWITKRMLFACGLVLVLLASMVYTVRGPMRAYDAPRDFLLIYSAARAWVQGGNPYDLEDQHAAYLNSIGPDVAPRDPSALDSLYPPTTFVMIAPVAALPLHTAHTLWISINTLVVIVGLLALLRVAHIDWMNPRGLLLLGIFLLMGPVHSAVTYGHLSLAVLLALTFSYLALARGRSMLCGLLLGVATATKPQLAGLFIVALFLLGHWRPAGWASLVVLAVLVIAAARMHAAGVEDWLGTWQANVAEFTQDDEPGDATWGARLRWQLVNLTPVVHNFTASKAIAQGVSFSVLAGVLAAVTWLWYRSPARPTMLGFWSILAVLTLLPVYHRYYDTCLLILPMVWCVRELRGPMHRWAMACLAVMAVFIVPSSTLVNVMEQHGYVGSAIADSFFWQAFVKLHQNYLLMLLLVLLVGGSAVQARRAAEDGRTRVDERDFPPSNRVS